MTIDDDRRALLLRIARCPLIKQALADHSHPCSRVVNEQQLGNEDERQVPEGWAGNLRHARVVFVSSNPAIGDGEIYPTSSWSDAHIVEFLDRRFDPAMTPPLVHENRVLMQDGTYWQESVGYWDEASAQARRLLLGRASPAWSFAMTEVVHCKSSKGRGVTPDSARTCADMYLDDIMSYTSAPIVIIVGRHAAAYMRERFPELPRPPAIRPTAELGGRQRTFLFVAGQGSSIVRALNRVYGMQTMRELRQLVSISA